TELTCVLVDKLLPTELHSVRTNDTADRVACQAAIEHVEADMPAGSPPGNEAAINIVPEGEASATTERLNFPAEILVTPVVFEHAGAIGSGHGCFGDDGPRGVHDRKLNGRASIAEVTANFKRC